MFPWCADVEKFYKLCDPGEYSSWLLAFFLVPLETIRAQCGGLFNPTAFFFLNLPYRVSGCRSFTLLDWIALVALGEVPAPCCGSRILWFMVNRLLMLGSACLHDV